MRNYTCLAFFFLFFSMNESIAVGNRKNRQPQPIKLFVFGDSYVDTGNWPKSFGSSWKEPYGRSYPGKPSGRFSDGRVLTDYIASFLGINSPLPYKRRKFGEKMVPYGINFACGGTGVFNTLVHEPNMTTQIDKLQLLLQENVYTKQDLSSSIALVSLAGNDYATYLASNGTLQLLGIIFKQVNFLVDHEKYSGTHLSESGPLISRLMSQILTGGMPSFTKSIINQMATDLKRLHELGVQKVVITAIEPLGCLPQFTAASSYQNCSSSANSISMFHNQLLEQSVRKLNNDTRKESVFIILDLYNAFISAFQVQDNNYIPAAGRFKFENPLKPCCEGVSRGYGCGNVDESTGKKMYTVCDNPKLSFFWDVIHPSQQGWLAVSSSLNSSLNQLFSRKHF